MHLKGLTGMQIQFKLERKQYETVSSVQCAGSVGSGGEVYKKVG